MKDRLVFCKKGVRTDVCFFSTMKPGKKLKEVIVDGNVLDKNLLRFLQIRLHLAMLHPASPALHHIETFCNVRATTTSQPPWAPGACFRGRITTRGGGAGAAGASHRTHGPAAEDGSTLASIKQISPPLLSEFPYWY